MVNQVVNLIVIQVVNQAVNHDWICKPSDEPSSKANQAENQDRG